MVSQVPRSLGGVGLHGRMTGYLGRACVGLHGGMTSCLCRAWCYSKQQQKMTPPKKDNLYNNSSIILLFLSYRPAYSHWGQNRTVEELAGAAILKIQTLILFSDQIRLKPNFWYRKLLIVIKIYQCKNLSLTNLRRKMLQQTIWIVMVFGVGVKGPVLIYWYFIYRFHCLIVSSIVSKSIIISFNFHNIYIYWTLSISLALSECSF